MRHRVAGKKLSRSADQRLALRRNLITDLFRYGAIQTTEAKVEAVRGQAEKIITMAKRSIASDDAVNRGSSRASAGTCWSAGNRREGRGRCRS